MSLIATNKVTAIIGMGITGQSVARYLTAQGQPFVWLDTRAEPASLAEILQQFPDVRYELGELNVDTLLSVSEVVVSPGLDVNCPAIIQAQENGVSVIGDIELFLRVIDKPLIAITGSNAKTTVTTLVGEMAKSAGVKIAVGGNIGIPALDLLAQNSDCYLLELSSFQLELIERLNADVATVLNISADHMDRYGNLAAYHRVKQKIYYGAKKVVVNRADALTHPPLATDVERYSFGLSQSDLNGFGLLESDGEQWLSFQFKALLPVSKIKLPGRHNIENVLAALAIGYAAGFAIDAMLEAVVSFSGLPHRCQWVGKVNDINFYNDSKGTNVGATLAALQGLKKDSGKIVLIAGGVGKGADFSPLAQALTSSRGVVLIGEDAAKIAVAIGDHAQCHFAENLDDAVAQALDLAQQGDDILLSPACASFDMFAGFEDRGNVFIKSVQGVLV